MTLVVNPWHYPPKRRICDASLLYLLNTRSKYAPFSEPVYLGAGNNGGRAEGFFNGIIDEVRIYDRPLTEAEIIRNYQSTTGLAVDRTDKLPTVWGALKKK